jgi:hypothetical protein
MNICHQVIFCAYIIISGKGIETSTLQVNQMINTLELLSNKVINAQKINTYPPHGHYCDLVDEAVTNPNF